ncbi:MAG: hypothetical protein LBK47_05900 [Prevotellaceae bacterium]|jgi:hypothetical protein|nr:hypothetical protein [Prevotellaceae bacterium]
MAKENDNQFTIFKTEEERISVDVRFEGETVWLTQKQLVEIFDTTK